jgi:hypothetical protein
MLQGGATGIKIDRWIDTQIDICQGRDIAQAVSRRLPTAAARVQNRVWSCGVL